MSLPTLSDADFDQEVMQSALPVFVKFTATWCGPCKAIAPIIDSLAKEFEGDMKFVAVDLDASPNTVAVHGVRSVPTIMIFQNGKLLVRDTGAQSRTRLTDMIESVLEGDAA